MTSIPEIEIDGRLIGPEHPPLVVAEIGINHGGSLEIAKIMVDAAYKAGVTHIKHQTHIPDEEMSGAAKQVVPGNDFRSIYDIISSCTLGKEEEAELKRYVESRGLTFLSTPFSIAAVHRLGELNVAAVKVGSGECTNIPLLEEITKLGKPVILSTGMNGLSAIDNAVRVFGKKSIPLALLHTTNLYPTPPELVRLGALSEMKDRYPDRVFGLSDHTTSNHACLAATALGASILERHFTDSMDRDGPDIICSMDSDAASELIHGSELIWRMRGGHKEEIEEEEITRQFAFATVVTTTAIKAGERFTRNNITVKRPGTGEVEAEAFSRLLGRTARADIEADVHVRWEDLEDE